MTEPVTWPVLTPEQLDRLLVSYFPGRDAAIKGSHEAFRAEVERLREALRDDPSKWRFDTLLYVGDALLDEMYPEPPFMSGGFPDTDPGVILLAGLRRCREALDHD